MYALNIIMVEFNPIYSETFVANETKMSRWHVGTHALCVGI